MNDKDRGDALVGMLMSAMSGAIVMLAIASLLGFGC